MTPEEIAAAFAEADAIIEKDRKKNKPTGRTSEGPTRFLETPKEITAGGGMIPSFTATAPVEGENQGLPQKIAGPVGGFAESVLTSGPGEFAQGALRGATNVIADTPRALENLATTKMVPDFLFGERKEGESLVDKLGRTYYEADRKAVLPGAEQIVQPFTDVGDVIRGEIGEERGVADEYGEITANLISLVLGVTSGLRAAGRGVSKVAKSQHKLARMSGIPQTFNAMRKNVMKSLQNEGFTVRQVKSYVKNLGKVKGKEGKFNVRLSQVGNKMSNHLDDFMTKEGKVFYDSMESFMDQFATVKAKAGGLIEDLRRLAGTTDEAKTAGIGKWAAKELETLTGKDTVSVKQLHSIRRALKNKYAKYKGKETSVVTPEEQAWARTLERVISNRIDNAVDNAVEFRLANATPDEAAAISENLQSYRNINGRYADAMATAENVDRILKPRVRIAGKTAEGTQPKVRPKAPDGIRSAMTNKHDMDQLAAFKRMHPEAADAVDESIFLGTTEMVMNNFSGGELGAAMTVDKSGKVMPRARTTTEYIKTRPRVAREGIIGTADRAVQKPVFETGVGPRQASSPTLEGTAQLGGNVVNPLPDGDLASRARRLKEATKRLNPFGGK